jgi:transposase InsO family protein
VHRREREPRASALPPAPHLLGHLAPTREGAEAGPWVYDDLVRRDFTADAPNDLWLTDITEHTDEGKLYLCAVKDTYSNRIVGCSITAEGARGSWWALRGSNPRPSPCKGETNLQVRTL